MLLVLRLAGMVVAGAAGWQLGLALAGVPAGVPAAGDAMRYVLVLALAGAALGLLLTPYATVVPLRWLWRLARGAAAPDLIGAVCGLLVGLLIATLASYPLSLLPAPLSRWLPFGVAVLFAWLGIAIGASRKDELFRAIRSAWAPGGAGVGGLYGAALLDTSAIIDGRIVEVRRSGFVSSDLAVPRFVLEELQQLADGADPARRQRGRRGLEMLERLRGGVGVEVIDTDYADLRGVDSKLIRLARQRRAAIVTTDYNLNRVASLQGVGVLNINDLANALRSVVVPGEDLALDVVQAGRERGQGIGYLEDGTMVVVEGARRLVGSKVDAEVTRILPTAGGRIIFCRLKLPPAGPPLAPADEAAPAPPAAAAPVGSAIAAAREPPPREGAPVDRARLRVVGDSAGPDGD
jgi:uncharacterized protein YacL